jgi:hypothetical protein
MWIFDVENNSNDFVQKNIHKKRAGESPAQGFQTVGLWLYG